MKNEPAYKRMGLDINENIPEGSSRLSLDSDFFLLDCVPVPNQSPHV